MRWWSDAVRAIRGRLTLLSLSRLPLIVVVALLVWWCRTS